MFCVVARLKSKNVRFLPSNVECLAYFRGLILVFLPKTKIQQAEGKGYFALFADPAGNRVGLYTD